MNSLLRSREGFSVCPFLFGPSSIGPPLYEGSLRVAQSRGSSPYHLTCACNVFERRGVIERIEGRSGVQLSSERSAVEAGSRPRLQHRRGSGIYRKPCFPACSELAFQQSIQ